MTDTGVAITKGIETQLSAVASHLHELALAQTQTGTELKEFKDRLLSSVDSLEKRVQDSVESLEKRVQSLERENSALAQRVSALQSRQAPLTAPAAWVAIIISGVVAAREFFGA